MSDAVKFFRKMKEDVKKETHVALVARITKIHVNGRIDAIADNGSVLINMRRLSGTYEIGNSVLVVFLDNDGDHGLSNGIVVGVIT